MTGFNTDPEVLAFGRSAIEALLNDTCFIRRKYVVPSGTPVSSVSDGRGGSVGGAGEAGVDAEGFVRDTTATPCRLQYVLPKRGHGEELAIAGVEELTVSNFSVSNTVTLLERDRVEVHERATGDVTLWEVTYAAPHTDGYCKQYAILRVGEGTPE